MITIIGFIAAFCFIVCGLPQVLLCIKQGHGEGLSKSFMWLWLLGELAQIFYAVFGLNYNIPLLLNGIFCFVICIIIMYYIYFPRKVKVYANKKN